MNVDVALTTLAAGVVSRLGPNLRSAVAKFLRDDLPDYTKAHRPVEISGVEGKVWVVQPRADGERIVLVITQKENEEGTPEYVVSAALPEDGAVPDELLAEPPHPGDFAIGADIARSARPAD
jgi:hypothetical protein